MRSKVPVPSRAERPGPPTTFEQFLAWCEAPSDHLAKDRRYGATSLDPDGSYRSYVLPEFRLRVDWLWQRPLPRLVDVLAQADHP